MLHPIFDQSLNRDYLQPYHKYMYENIFLNYSDVRKNIGIVKEEIKELYKTFSNNDLSKTILSVTSVSAFNRKLGGKNKSTLKVNFYQDNKTDHDGSYSDFRNEIIIFLNGREKETLLHEHVHEAMNTLFEEDSNPYKTFEQAHNFHKALFLTLHDINIKLGSLEKSPLNFLGSLKYFANEIMNSYGIKCYPEAPADHSVQDNKNKQLTVSTRDTDSVEIPIIETLLPEISSFSETIDINPTQLTLQEIKSTHVVVDYSYKKLNSMNLYESAITYKSLYSNLEYNDKSIAESFSIEHPKQCPLNPHINEYAELLCVYENYDIPEQDCEIIAKFYEMSLGNNVGAIFPHIYRYHQQVISPAAEKYYLENTNQSLAEECFNLY